MPDAESPPASLDSSQSARHRRLRGIERVLQQLNELVLIQFALTYYLDNAALFLLLRVVVHVSFVARIANPQIAPCVATTILMLLFHLFSGPPQQADNGPSYGFLNGGIITDFVGQTPVSIFHLILLDNVILVLQLVSLATTFEHRKLKEKKEGESSTQDLAAEEEGTRRSQDGEADNDDIELQDLNATSKGANSIGSHPSDRFYTANYTAINLDIVTSLQALAKAPASVPAVDDNGALGSVMNSLVARVVHRQ